MIPLSSLRVCRPFGTLFLLSTLLVSVAGCSKSSPGKELQPGSYRAVVEAEDGHEVPFGLDVSREEQRYVLYVLNGEERLRVDDVQVETGRVTARLPGYESTLGATVSGDELKGTITMTYPGDRTREWPFRARLGETWRFFAERRSDNADMAGRWEITLTDGRGHKSRAVAELQQRHDEVGGTVVNPATDEGRLAGEVHDEELRLSRFDGGAMVVYAGKLDMEGRWVGTAWSDREGTRRFVAVRNPDAVVDPPVTAWTGAADEPLQFEFPDLDGQPIAATDPRLGGRPMIVALLGSWNPASHEAATVLGQLERRYGPRGLAIVGLMFEQHADRSQATAAIRRFREARDVTFPTLLAGTVDDATVALPQLEGGVTAYPTFLFVDRGGLVRWVHAGLYGPAAGLLHEQTLREFEQAIETLLAEEDVPSATETAAAQP